jgi:hypothetical protein
LNVDFKEKWFKQIIRFFSLHLFTLEFQISTFFYL